MDATSASTKTRTDGKRLSVRSGRKSRNMRSTARSTVLGSSPPPPPPEIAA